MMRIHTNKSIFLLFLILTTIQVANTTEVSDLLNILQQRISDIQDYNLLVGQSNFNQAMNQDELDQTLEIQQHEFSAFAKDATSTEMVRAVAEYNRSQLKKSNFTGSMYQLKGIGKTTHSYAVYSLNDPTNADLQTIKSLNTKTDEQDRLVPDNQVIFKMVFQQHLLMTPDYLVNAQPAPANRNDHTENELFVLPPKSSISITESIPDSHRNSFFPFWHEEALYQANSSNANILRKTEDEIELQITPANSPKNLSYIIYCKPDGQVNRFIKKKDGHVFLDATYMNYVAVTPDGVEIPQVGRMWFPESNTDGAFPRRETTRFNFLLHCEVNTGLSLDDLYIQASTDTSIKDMRQVDHSAPFSESLQHMTRITTTNPVKIGPNLPENIQELVNE